MRAIDQKTKSLNRDTEDVSGARPEQGKIMQELGQRIMAVIDKYSKDKGFSLILDVSSGRPVLFAANDIDITSDIVKLRPTLPRPVPFASAQWRLCCPSRSPP
jgi:Skp family chaperone for outer membrane proteins